MSEPTIRTSTVIDALLDVHRRLQGLVYPPSQSTGRTPSLYFLGDYTDLTDEYVHLVGKVPDTELDHAGAGPAAREESYVLQIRCSTNVPGVDGPTALSRLQEITQVVEVAFRDQDTGQPIPPDLDDREIVRGGLFRIEVDAYGTDTGAEAVADLFFQFYARI